VLKRQLTDLIKAARKGSADSDPALNAKRP
jgi:hypothetical protein